MIMRAIAKLFAMDPTTWERHANPWSAWTRLPVLPLICLAIWAREWIGAWCLLPLALLALWTWVNPRAFPPPVSTRSWAARAVMGERVWLNRQNVAIPRHHAVWAGLLSVGPALGMAPLIWSLWALQIWPLILGLVVVLGGKLWFLDRMVWLYDDMARQHPDYA
ncbi:MAG: DUF6653 family protein, partial [Pseudomonadota bacterium]